MEKRFISLKNGELFQMLEGRSRKEEDSMTRYYEHRKFFSKWVKKLGQPTGKNIKQNLIKHALNLQTSALVYFGAQSLLEKILLMFTTFPPPLLT